MKPTPKRNHYTVCGSDGRVGGYDVSRGKWYRVVAASREEALEKVKAKDETIFEPFFIISGWPLVLLINEETKDAEAD